MKTSDPVKKGDLLYSGKAKSVYSTNDEQLVLLEFRDDTSAFDGQKVARLDRKGEVNNRFNAFIMEYLAAHNVPTHFVRRLSATESLVKRLQMLPIECVVRNIAAGSLCRRLGIDEGMPLQPPLYELFLKNDSLHDPFINEQHAISFGWASEKELAEMKRLTLQINELLSDLFHEKGLRLVDYKLEFGLIDGQLTLGDEFSPDGCRIWDEDNEKLDKDRFRLGLGDVIESYESVAARLGVPPYRGSSSEL